MKSSASQHQHGFTLIELMVALVIGMAILIALTSAFMSGSRASSVQDRVGAMQENGRYALYFLQRDIRMAGYPSSDPTIVPFPTTGAANAITRDGSGNNNSDQIAIQYRADMAGGSRDCLGAVVPVGNMVVNTYAVSKDPNTGISRLTCNDQPIVEGIEAMQILYGVDTDQDPTQPGYGYADYFVPANAAVFAGDPTIWQEKVVSVRIAILATTITPVSGDNDANSATTYVLFDAPPVGPLVYNVNNVPQSLWIRGKVYTATVELRNRSS